MLLLLLPQVALLRNYTNGLSALVSSLKAALKTVGNTSSSSKPAGTGTRQVGCVRLLQHSPWKRHMEKAQQGGCCPPGVHNP
jgi:hypothetical protein